MAKYIQTDVSLTYNSVDLSDHVESVEVTMNSDTVDLTAMGDTSRSYGLGLRDDTVSVTFYQDYAAGKVHATLSPLSGVSAGATMVIKPTSAPVSATNPSFTLTAILPEYSPISGGVGEASMTTVEFKCAEGSSIVIATA